MFLREVWFSVFSIQLLGFCRLRFLLTYTHLPPKDEYKYVYSETRSCNWLRHCAANLKDAFSISHLSLCVLWIPVYVAKVVTVTCCKNVRLQEGYHVIWLSITKRRWPMTNHVFFNTAWFANTSMKVETVMFTWHITHKWYMYFLKYYSLFVYFTLPSPETLQSLSHPSPCNGPVFSHKPGREGCRYVIVFHQGKVNLKRLGVNKKRWILGVGVKVDVLGIRVVWGSRGSWCWRYWEVGEFRFK
jgi:hypothetical protein